MPRTANLHIVYRSINKPLTIWGVERRLFFLALLMGGATFNFFGSLIGGIFMFRRPLPISALDHGIRPAAP